MRRSLALVASYAKHGIGARSTHFAADLRGANTGGSPGTLPTACTCQRTCQLLSQQECKDSTHAHGNVWDANVS